MTSNNPDNPMPSENDPEKSSQSAKQADATSAEAIAEAAIAAAKAQAKTDAEPQASSAEDGADDGASTNADDPLGFDDARMPEADDDALDLSAEINNPEEGAAGASSTAEANGADAGEDSPVDLVAELAAANAKADEHWNRVLRMQADMENERKRAQKQVANAHKFAIEGFVNELLPIKDSLEMGLDAAKADDADLQKIVEGSELTLKLLAQAFEKFQIAEVASMDEKFDPNVHQAMSMQEAEGKPSNTVIGVMQKGYTLNERLIRPALVTVSK